MTHYTCPECGGMSDRPKLCEDNECLRKGQELIECNCTDGEHGDDYDDAHYA